MLKPSVMESPSGIMRTPPFDSACAEKTPASPAHDISANAAPSPMRLLRIADPYLTFAWQGHVVSKSQYAPFVQRTRCCHEILWAVVARAQRQLGDLIKLGRFLRIGGMGHIARWGAHMRIWLCVAIFIA